MGRGVEDGKKGEEGEGAEDSDMSDEEIEVHQIRATVVRMVSLPSGKDQQGHRHKQKRGSALSKTVKPVVTG